MKNGTCRLQLISLHWPKGASVLRVPLFWGFKGKPTRQPEHGGCHNHHVGGPLKRQTQKRSELLVYPQHGCVFLRVPLLVDFRGKPKEKMKPLWGSPKRKHTHEMYVSTTSTAPFHPQKNTENILGKAKCQLLSGLHWLFGG